MSERQTTNSREPNGASVPTIDFQPQLNGSYRIRIAEAHKKQGFAVLWQSGMVHCFFPDIYLINTHQRRLLEEASVPFEVI